MIFMNASKTKLVADTALGPLIEHVNKTPGAKADLTRRMEAILGYEIARQVVEGWVHPEPDRRVEPKLGLGIILLRVASDMLDGGEHALDLRAVIKKSKFSKNGTRK